MKTAIVARGFALAMAIASVPVAGPAQQQQQAQHMQRMQAQAQQLHESMQRMQHMQERAHATEQQMMQQIERMRAAQGAQLGAQDQARLREHVHVRDMAHALSGAAGDMAQAMERARDMLHDPGARWTPEMEQDMQRLHERLRDTTEPMEESIEIMERLRDQLSRPE